MESIISAAREKCVWYSRDRKVLSFHEVVGFTKATFKSKIDMFRFVIGLIDLDYRVM